MELFNPSILHLSGQVNILQPLHRIIEWRGKPCSIRCDNGPEYVSQALKAWAIKNKVELAYIQPGKPQQSAYIERFNRKVRYYWLNQYIFHTLTEMQEYATRWQWIYNNERPNMGLGGFTPMQHLLKMQTGYG